MEQEMIETVLDDLNNGQAMGDLSKALQAVVAAVRKSGKVGSVTYSIKVRPASKGEVRTIMLEDTLKITEPQCDRPASIFYVTKDNQLQRTDPNQTEMELKELPATQPAARMVNLQVPMREAVTGS